MFKNLHLPPPLMGSQSHKHLLHALESILIVAVAVALFLLAATQGWGDAIVDFMWSAMGFEAPTRF